MNPIIECRSLDEVRGQIDRLDRQLVGPIAERGAYVQQAARAALHPPPSSPTPLH